MAVSGYETGPIACEAAFVADFDIDTGIPIEAMVSQMDSDRRTMAAREGMVMKYMPLRFDPATGAHQIGGRYLFRTERQMRDYMRFTSEELEFEPSVKFWERPFFSNIQRQAWRVVGAHAFAPVDTHYANRVETFDWSPEATPEMLKSAWPTLCQAASDEGLASVWLLVDPDGRRATILTAIRQQPGDRDADCASRTISALERRPSLSRHLGNQIEPVSLFDRTSLNLAIWLPLSDAGGGDACLFPTYPVHPRPADMPR